jgi:RNA polymerase sigma-70 factor, ECF subfamily
MSRADAAAIFDRRHLAVFRFLRRMTGNATVAEDLTQEVFLRVVRGAETYEERERELSWVFRIARHVLVDRHRSEARSPAAVAIEDVSPFAVPPLQSVGLAIDEALVRLPDAEREAFLLREVAGLGYQEIAKVTVATPDAVRMRIYRARLALRTALGPARRSVESA